MDSRLRKIAFLNHKAGVGKSTLVYHLAWMYEELGLRVLAVDLDPQCDLSEMFLEVQRLNEIWNRDGDEKGIVASLQSQMESPNQSSGLVIEKVSSRIGLLVGSLSLSSFEAGFRFGMAGDEWALAASSSLHRIIQSQGEAFGADIVLLDLASNLSPLNRAALLTANYAVMPLMPDVFALQSIRGIDEALRSWGLQWQDVVSEGVATGGRIPSKLADLAGYILMQNSGPAIDSAKWIAQIPEEYGEAFGRTQLPRVDGPHPNCLAVLKRYRSLMPMALEARKPVFQLTPSDGAIGSHGVAVRDAYADFKKVALVLAERCRVEVAQAGATGLERQGTPKLWFGS